MRRNANLERARRRGYLRLGPTGDRRLEEEWAAWCHEAGCDFLVARVRGGSASIHLEPAARRPLSPMAQQEMDELVRRARRGSRRGGEVRLEGLPEEQLTGWLREVQDLLARDRTVERGRQLAGGLAEGRARCRDNTGYEDVLEVGDEVYLREIPNAPGRCLVVGDRSDPLLGVPLDRFELEAG